MRNNILKIIKIVLGRDRVGRSVTIYPDDIFIVSYPRSGNTWMRFLVGNLFFRDETITFANIEEKVPDIHQNTDKYLLRLPRPRILKSHEYFDPRYRTVIYIVRDPRDVCVSYYYYHLKFRKIDENYSMDQFTKGFIAGDLDPYGSWGEHVGSWLETRGGTTRFLMIRYEDLLVEVNKIVDEVVSFLNIEISQSLQEKAIQLSSFETMQRLEKQQAHLWKNIKKSRRDIQFIRVGQTNVWKNELSIESKEMIEGAWAKYMDRLGYPS